MLGKIRAAALNLCAVLILVAATSETLSATASADSKSVDPIVLKGQYYFYAMPETDEGSICVERYWFNDDGTEITASGDEIVVYRFRVENDDHGAVLTRSAVSTNGKPDCLGNRNVTRPGSETRNGIYRTKDGGLELTVSMMASNGMPVTGLVGHFVQSQDGLPPPSDPSSVIPPPPNRQSAVIMGGTFPGIYDRPVPEGATHACESYYPPDVEDGLRGGVTLIAFKINANGAVSGLKVSKPSGQADLDEAAMACVKKWTYLPVLVGGKSVSVPWLAKVTWQADVPGTTYETDMRILRRDVWNCLWSSAEAKSLPAQFDGSVEAHIFFPGSSTPVKIEIATSTGNQKLDAAALECMHQSTALTDIAKNRGNVTDGYIRLALWNPGAIVEPASDNLFDAAKAGDLARVKALIAAGADVNAKDDAGETSALDWAARKNHIDIMELLLSDGANVQARDFYGFTPLHHAASWGSEEGVRLLLAHGADVNDSKNNAGQSPLHYAVSPGREGVVALLLDHGADVNAKDINLETPLHLVAKQNESGFELQSETPDNGDTKMVAFLLARGADINAKDKWNNTPLHFAAWGGHNGVVELLLTNRAEINVKNVSGETPLSEARKAGHGNVVELLRQHGGSD